jgi:hypothetical protein
MMRNVAVRPCKFCGKLFATKSPQRRKFCCVKHQRNFNMVGWIRRSVERGKMAQDDWRVMLADNIERLMFRLRAENAKKLGISVDDLVRMIETFEAQANADAQHAESRGDLK